MNGAQDHPRDLLLAYMEGDLTGEELERTARHVETCDSCRAWCDAFDTLRSLAPARGEASPHPSTDDLARSVLMPEELDEWIRHEIEAHLTACGECRRQAHLVAVGAGRSHSAGAWERMSAGSSWRSLPVAASLLLAVGLVVSGLLWLGERDEVPVSRHLENVTLRGDRVIESENEVEVLDSTIPGGSDITLRAGEVVALGNGFTVADGASLSIEIAAIATDDLDSG